MKKLNDAQRDELISQYCELVVDNMDMDSLVQYAQEQLANYFDKLSDIELKEDIDNYDEDLFDELVDNVTPLKVISSQELEGDISTIKDSDYADKVDRLVESMETN